MIYSNSYAHRRTIKPAESGAAIKKIFSKDKRKISVLYQNLLAKQKIS
jgi:hypothetical protein